VKKVVGVFVRFRVVSVEALTKSRYPQMCITHLRPSVAILQRHIPL
jgi:hypothetical protein